MPIDDWIELDLERETEGVMVESFLRIAFHIYKAAITAKLSRILLERHSDIVSTTINYKH